MKQAMFSLRTGLAVMVLSGFAQGQTAGFDILIPHLVVGGGYMSFLDISDPLGLKSREVQISFFDDRGSPLAIRMDGATASASKTITLSRFEEIRIVLTSDLNAPQQGWARITCDRGTKLYASLRFVFGGTIAAPLDAVGIVPSGVQRTWYINSGKHASGEYTGVAVVNPNGLSVDVEFNLYQGPNRVPGTTSVQRALPSQGHLALFAHELFPVNFSGTATLEVYGVQGNLALAVLHADTSQYSSLPAQAAVELWDFTVSDAAGNSIEKGTWCWKYNESTGFHGVASIDARRVDLRGSFDASRFELVRFAGTQDGSGADLYVYQGTLETQGDRATLRGKRLEVGSGGTVLRTSDFSATRQP